MLSANIFCLGLNVLMDKLYKELVVHSCECCIVIQCTVQWETNHWPVVVGCLSALGSGADEIYLYELIVS